MTDSGSGDHETPQFSLVVGGPFNGILIRLGLTAADQLPTQRAAIGVALLAWLLPALLAVAQSIIDSGFSGWGYFTDSTVYTRYLVAIWAMVATERYADGRTLMLAHQFHKARLLAEDSLPAFTSALAVADHRSSSWRAELAILAVAILWSTATTHYAVELAGSSWEGKVAAGGAVLSWAGETARFLSNPFFLFLVLRWIWRFLVWAELLYRISRLPLRLMPLHSDRSAGLGFLAIYPGVFSGFVFALSCVVASAMLKELDLVQHSPTTVWIALAVWLAIILVLFLGPLLVFTPLLIGVREQALRDYGRLADQHHVAFYRKWVEGARNGEDLMGAADLSAASGLNSNLQAVRELNVVPVDRAAVVQLIIAAGIPLLVVVAREVPLADIVKWIVGKIL